MDRAEQPPREHAHGHRLNLCIYIHLAANYRNGTTMITVLGWLGAVFAVVSYSQTSTLRLRQIGLISSLALLSFNVMMGIWSNVALESVLGVVNAGRLVQLRSRPRRIRCRIRRNRRVVDGMSMISR
jgi:Bacterial inner membrane protein